MKPPEVAEGVHRLGTKWANFYLVRDGDDWTLVDAGYPRYLEQLIAALAALGSSLEAVTGVIVTHHHVDHVGTAEAVRSRSGARVLVHAGDADIVSGARRSHVPPGFYRQSWRPSMVRYLSHTVRVGGARYRPVAAIEQLSDDRTLDVPGRPRVLHVPGHTAGHCSVVLPDRGVLFTGDALVNFDYASGRLGLRLHRFNEDRPRALASLDRLAALNADTLLFGHGDPWRDGLTRALDVARAADEAPERTP
jgi:glyoxylase-like metal-dependent hydrolase (beta-lactamase superfamily II)